MEECEPLEEIIAAVISVMGGVRVAESFVCTVGIVGSLSMILS